jgi:heat shock protein HslJ
MAGSGRRRTAWLLAVPLVLAGCGAPSAGGSPADDAVGEWELVSGTASGRPLPQPAGSRATLTLDGSQAGGTSFCNHYSATYRGNGGAIEFDAIGGTEMGCAPEVMEAEYAYSAALAEVDTVVVEAVDLVLTGPGVELRFRPVPEVPPSELVGTTWVLDTLLDGEVASSVVGGSMVRLEADGTVTATTACHTLSGTWTRDDDEVLVRDLVTQELDCPADFRTQDVHELAVLADGFRSSVEADRLTALDADGRGLVYRAEG